MEKRVMIVDDEPDILSSLKTILESQKYDVITVESGFECLKEIEKGFRGIVLMDLMMPEMDGWDTIQEILDRGLMKNVVIEIITGKGTEDHDKIIGLEPYIHDYLAKPFISDELILNVDNLYLKLFNNNKIKK